MRYVADTDTKDRNTLRNANSKVNAKRIMIPSHHYISKALLLLAAVLVPLQQSVAATCCCGQGAEVGHAIESETSCCSQAKLSCCSSDATEEPHCCDGQQGSGPSSCQCPVGSCGQDNPTTAEPPATNEFAVGIELVEVALTGTATGAAKPSSAKALASSATITALGSVERCVLLCRFTL